MCAGTKRLKLGLALVLTVAFFAVPSMGELQVNVFNPFTLQSKSVVAADSASSVVLTDLLLVSGGTTLQLKDGDPRPTITLRASEIRIPQRPSLRSAFAIIPYAASVW